VADPRAIETIGQLDGQPSCFCPTLAMKWWTRSAPGTLSLPWLHSRGPQAVAGMTTFLGQMAGAQAVKNCRQRASISKETLLKTGVSLLYRLAVRP